VTRRAAARGLRRPRDLPKETNGTNGTMAQNVPFEPTYQRTIEGRPEGESPGVYSPATAPFVLIVFHSQLR
jgi:hypothetical protein